MITIRSGVKPLSSDYQWRPLLWGYSRLGQEKWIWSTAMLSENPQDCHSLLQYGEMKITLQFFLAYLLFQRGCQAIYRRATSRFRNLLRQLFQKKRSFLCL